MSISGLSIQGFFDDLTDLFIELTKDHRVESLDLSVGKDCFLWDASIRSLLPLNSAK